MKKTILLVSLAFLGLNITNAQVGIGTTNPKDDAALDVESTEKGFLPPRMDTDQRDGINGGDIAQGLVIYNTDVNCLQWYDGSFWFDGCEGGLIPGALSECSDPEFIPPFLPADETIVKDVTNPITGDTWMDRNLGAYTVDRTTPSADGGTDCWAYSNLYQWGRDSDGHDDRESAIYDAVNNNSEGVASFEPNLPSAWDGQFITRDILNNNDWVNTSATDAAGNTISDLWQGDGGVNDPCPVGYRVPTEAEWEAEWDSWDGDLDNSTPPSFNSTREGAINSPLKLPVGGRKSYGDGLIYNVELGYYWSSTISGTYAKLFYFGSSNVLITDFFRAFACSVRCIKD